MHTQIRKIGNSRGIIIPAVFIEQLHLESEVELLLEGDTLILKPVRPPRQGWFDQYDPRKDVSPLADMKDLESEQAEWEW